MAKKDNIQISFGINGMERQGFSHLIDEKTYTFMQNGNIETDDESIALTNEQSNYLCSKLKPGYIVIGTKYDSINNSMFLNFAIPIQFLKINLPKFSVPNSPILRKSSGLKGPDSDFTLYFSHSCNKNSLVTPTSIKSHGNISSLSRVRVV